VVAVVATDEQVRLRVRAELGEQLSPRRAGCCRRVRYWQLRPPDGDAHLAKDGGARPRGGRNHILARWARAATVRWLARAILRRAHCPLDLQDELRLRLGSIVLGVRDRLCTCGPPYLRALYATHIHRTGW
jgi:hypothetical protein